MTAQHALDPVRLEEIVAVLPRGGRIVPPGPIARQPLTDVTHDSRQAGPGVLFACRLGARADGHDFAPEAVAAGSPALLVERVLDLDVPQVVVPSVAESLGPVAARVHGNPSAEMLVCGITGTNGKTTSTYLLRAVLTAAGHRTGLVGTVQTLIDDEPMPGVRTTPESTDLQRLLRSMRDRGVGAVAMEVSSHGLALGRVSGTRFAVAVFTNLSQDHLDFHTDMEDYFAAKAGLFTSAFTERAVINVDDDYGRRLAVMAAEAGLEVLTVSLSGTHEGGAAHIHARDLRIGEAGSTFTAVVDGRSVPVRLALSGDFNIANALGVLGVAVAIGIPLETAVEGIGSVTGVPGRMEQIEAGQPFTVLVDYAHTPDSLSRVLRAARSLCSGRVLVVVGCGGDRDRGKRPLMGAAAATLADLAVLTSDNPRSEDPEAILDAMIGGVPAGRRDRVVRQVDRRAAIGLALADAEPEDIVVIAGKGHERGQEFADRVADFDDGEVARALLEEAR